MSGSIVSNSSGNLELYSGATKVLTADATTGVTNFIKIPTAPTPTAGTNNTQLATTAFVATTASTKANINSPTLNGPVLVLNGSYGLEFSATTNYTYIDFHSSDTFDDYEARISCDGNKNLNITANSITLSVAPTAPTAPTGTNNAQLATTAFAYGALSYGGQTTNGTNGYQKLPSGLIVQWFENVQNPGANTDAVVNFPIAFPNNCFFVSIVNGDVVTQPNAVVGKKDGSVTKTGITWRTNQSGSTRVSILAIGY